jgi:hypothetical protein
MKKTNAKLKGKTSVRVRKILYIQAKRIATAEWIPIEKVIDALLGLGLKMYRNQANAELVSPNKDNGK